MINLFSSFDLTQASILLADFDVSKFALGVLLFASSLWLIFLVLIQRGKGGGLTGALGGSGGGSAFGAKAGDAFTKITVISATIWIFLCMVTIAWINPPPPPLAGDDLPAVMGGTEDGTDGSEAADGEETAEGESTSGDANAEAGSNEAGAVEGEATEGQPVEGVAGDDNSFEPGGDPEAAGGNDADSSDDSGS